MKTQAAIPIEDASVAYALRELVKDRFSIIGGKVKASAVTEVWEYTFSDPREIVRLQQEREAGHIVTVQGYVDGVATLYAKLAA